jgi:Uncharacterized conserved protein (DUF2285)
MRCVQHVITRTNGDEFVQIRTSDRFITLSLRGYTVTRGPVHLTIYISGLQNARSNGLMLLRLSDLTTLDPRWVKLSRHRLLLRDALICLDAKQAGASYREMALIIYGHHRTRAAWDGPSRSLKDRIRYALARGLYLRDGAYRSLLTDGV